MADLAWPATLPDFDNTLLGRYEEQQGSTTVRSSVDVGPAKTRQRTTASVDRLTVGYVMDGSQVEDFVQFFEDTTRHGALRFEATHPRTNTIVEVRFRNRPTYTPFSTNKYKVTFEVEVLP